MNFIHRFFLCFCIGSSAFAAAQPAPKTTQIPPKPPVGFGVPNIPHFNSTKDPMHAIFYGTPDLLFRPRYEYATQNAPLLDAKTVTLRSLVGYQTKSFYDFDVYAQFSNVYPFDNEYNSTKNGQTRYVIIADPAFSEFTQAYVGFSGIPNTYIKAGRQLISLDNQRFVGPVNFRQNLQNFGAISGYNKTIDNLSVFVGYLNRIETVLARTVDANDWIVNLKYDRFPFLNVAAYTYLLDHYGTLTPKVIALESTDTYGLRLTGNIPVKDVTVSYTAESAYQTSAANNPTPFSAYYYHIGLGSNWKSWFLSIDQELLSGKHATPTATAPYKSFRTPLATKHLFLGWADMFLTTPLGGMIGSFASVIYSVPTSSFSLTNDTKLSAIYYDFYAQSGGQHYGQEVDLDVTKVINKMFNVSLTFADFMSDLPKPTIYPSTRKVWLTMVATF